MRDEGGTALRAGIMPMKVHREIIAGRNAADPFLIPHPSPPIPRA